MTLTVETSISVGEFLTQLAEKAGLKIEDSGPENATLVFYMGSGRSQRVWVRALGTDAAKNLIVGFFSPVLQLPTGEMLGQKAANELLRENATLAHGAWAIQNTNDGEYLVATDTQIAQTMDHQEFEASVRGLAATADAKERELGADVF